MSTASFLECHISQIPAIQLFPNLGYNYIAPEEVAVERRGNLGQVLLEGVLAAQLKRGKQDAK
jgi:type I restriction enzyme, R subunit